MIGRSIERLARTTALIGGVVLTALVLLTCASVGGRVLNSLAHSAFVETRAPALASTLLDAGIGPILGDFELVEAGIAFAIFCFLPVCQLYRGHATVDVMTRFLPAVLERGLRAFWEIVLSAVILLIAWRLYAGLEGKLRNGETTFLLQFPVWWAYAASFAAAAVACVVAVYSSARALRDVRRGEDAEALR